VGRHIESLDADPDVLGSSDFPSHRAALYSLGVSGVAGKNYPAKRRRRPTYNVLTTGAAKMWYFSWILGVLLAVAFGIINVLWLESEKCLDDDNQ
jgi:cyd operon protein YbgT